MAAHDDDQDEGSIPLLETEPSSREPIFSKRQAQRTSPLRFTLATALLILGGLAAFYLWTTGRPAYTKYSRHWNAHSKQLYFRNGTAAKETELVRSLFGRAKDLGIDKFDLVASVYYRQYPENLYHGGHRSADESNSTLANASSTADATPTSTETAARALVSISAMVSSNGGITYLDYGGQDWKPPPEPEWQRIFSAPVIRELQVSQSGSAVVQVVLPGKIVAALRNEPRGRTELKATFHLIPSQATAPFYAANSTYYLGDTKDSDRYGYHGFGGPRENFPLPYPAIGRNVSEQNSTFQPWESRIPGSPSIDLIRHIYPPWQRDEQRFVDETKDEAEDEEDDVEGEKKAKEEETSPWRADVETGRPKERTVLVKRSMVTLIEQSPVYSLPKFQKKMRALKRREEGCRRGRRRWETCTRTFTNRGHFESLLEMAHAEGPDPADTQSSTDNIVRYRYPPFLHSNYGRIGPRDYTNLTEATGAENDDESDFSFDWHVSFSPISAVKAAFAEAYHDAMRGRGFSGFGDDYMIFDRPNDVNALWQDQAELLNAIMGHSFSPKSHPILRLVLLNLAGVASLVSTVLTAYFWYSRVLSTGISLPAHAVDTLVRFVAFGAGVVQRGDKRDWMMSPVVVLISALVWSLCARLEWVGGGPKEMVLVGVRRRRATKGERASAREDGKFTWPMWGGLVAFALVFTAVLLPMLPPIMIESLPTPFPSKLIAFLTPIVQASSIQLFASQLHLNHRLSKFGANYRLVPFLDLASAVLSTLPVLLSAWWGRWETMPAFGWAELCWIVGTALLAWQSWMYPRCEQRENEEQ